MSLPSSTTFLMNPSSASTAGVLISDLFCGFSRLVHCVPCELTHAWNSIVTEAVFGPLHSPLMLAAVHLIVEWPAVASVVSPPLPVNVCFSTGLTGVHSYLPRPVGARAMQRTPL